MSSRKRQFKPATGFRSSVKVARNIPGSLSSDQATLNRQTISARSELSKPTTRISAPLKSRDRSPLRVRKKISNPRTRETLPLKVSERNAVPEASNSTTISDWSLRHRPAAFQNLSAEEAMFVSYIYNWGLNRARQIAAKLRYKLRRPLPELLAALCELDKNCSARNAAHTRP